MNQNNDSNSDHWPEDLVAPVGESLASAKLDPVDRALMKSRLLARVRDENNTGNTVTIKKSDDGWEWFSPRVKIKVLRSDPASTSYLLKLEAGAIVWPHRHRQDEECMVLEGEIVVGEDRVGAGAYHLAPAGMVHQPIRTDVGATLFLRGVMPSVRDLAVRDSIRSVFD
jgi:anti-sigma factor ChrR (cupin superfamily)